MKRFVKSFMLASLAVLLASCNCYNKMLKKVDRIDVSATPAVVTLKGNNAVTDIKVNFPAKYFNKRAVLKITPVLVFEGGEIAGTPKFVQGEKVKDNYEVISYKQGGSYTQSVSIPYDKRAKISTLELRIESKCSKNCGKKRKQFLPFAAIPVAEGVSTVQLLADNAAYLTIMPDNFKRVTTITKDAEIMYQINRSNVRPGELTKEQVKMFEDFVKEYSNKDRATLGNVYAKGYASPDGPVKFNDKLSQARSESGKKVVAKLLKDAGLDIDAAAYGEDWDGFKELVEKSNIKDKNLILQVLSLYNSPAERESEIKNMSSVFNELKEEVLPELRRSQIVNSTDIQGKTDAEIMAAFRNGQELTVEEYLYAAETLANGAEEQVAILTAASKKYNDARVYNNLGIAQAKAGDKAAALKSFEKAAKMDSSSEITKNLILGNLANGNTAEAKKYAKAADAQAKAAIAAAEGDYKAAAQNLDGYNEAVAQVMSNNLSAAKQAISKDNSADADYLRAVIAAKEGDLKTAEAQLKSAVSKNPKLAQKAANDINLKALNK